MACDRIPGRDNARRDFPCVPPERVPVGHGLGGSRIVADTVSRIDLDQFLQQVARQFLVRLQLTCRHNRPVCHRVSNRRLFLATGREQQQES
jgi:hypothetical protein